MKSLYYRKTATGDRFKACLFLFAEKEEIMNNRTLGKIGENAAAELLREEGYRILDRNYYCRYGEIDIICEKNGKIFFTEVKTRKSLQYGEPAEAVDYRKRRHMKNCAAEYIAKNGELCDTGFLVIEIYINAIEDFI